MVDETPSLPARNGSHGPPPPASWEATLHHSSRALYADQSIGEGHDVAPALHLTTTFHYPSNPDELVSLAGYSAPYPPEKHFYSRLSNENVSRLEAVLTSLLGAPSLVYGSGLSAAYAIYAQIRPARVFITGGYSGVHGVLAQLNRIAGGTAYVKHSLAEAVQSAERGDVVHVETPLNPTGEAIDLAHWVEVAHGKGAHVVVDATFAPPPLQDPFTLGADVVMHSGTKYFGGHSDLLLGVAATRNEGWIRGMATDRIFQGSVPGNMEAWLAIRSLRTLDVRVRRQSQSATALVERIWADVERQRVGGEETGEGTEAETAVALGKVLVEVKHSSVQFRERGGSDKSKTREGHSSWFSAQMPTGLHSPVFAVLCSSKDLARRLPSKLRLFSHATSLGGVESLIEWRAMSDANVDERLMRVSIGMEHVDDLYDDLGNACVELLKEEKAKTQNGH